MLKTQFAAGAAWAIANPRLSAGTAQTAQRERERTQLSRGGLEAWVRAEYAIFRLFIQFITSVLLEYHEGNPFGQGQHDCATLDNGVKFMAMGFNCVIPSPRRIPASLPSLPPLAAPAAAPAPSAKYLGPTLSTPAPATPVPLPVSECPTRTFTLCLGMQPIADGSDETGAALLKERFEDITGHSYGKISHSTMSDAAALGVADELDHDGQGASRSLARARALSPLACTRARALAARLHARARL